MIKIIKNTDTVTHVYCGQEIEAGGQYQIQKIEELKLSIDDSLLADIALGKAVINNGSADLSGVSVQIDFLKSNLAKEVVTQLEKPDKDLVLASDAQPFDGDTCTLSIPVPGALGQLGSRQIAGGYAFTDQYGWGDRVSRVELLDRDYLYAGTLYPAEPAPGVTWAEALPLGVPIGSFTDDALDEEFRGWRLWADDGGQGGVDIDPLGGLGQLLALCYLTITIEKQAGSPATRGALNAWWAKPAL